MTNSNNPSPDPFAMVNAIRTQGPAPVHLWDPPFCGDIDMRICRDGTWVHEGRPIRRMAMVKLFASILKREGDEYFLVTPVEKVRIQVEDTPFLAVVMDVHYPDSRSQSELQRADADASQSAATTTAQDTTADTGQEIVFTTNVGEEVRLDSNHPLSIGLDPESESAASEAPHPVIKVRAGLHALISRAVFYRLVELAVSRGKGEQEEIGVWSHGIFFPLSAAPGKV